MTGAILAIENGKNRNDGLFVLCASHTRSVATIRQ